MNPLKDHGDHKIEERKKDPIGKDDERLKKESAAKMSRISTEAVSRQVNITPNWVRHPKTTSNFNCKPESESESNGNVACLAVRRTRSNLKIHVVQL